MKEAIDFTWMDPDELVDEDLTLVLARRSPAARVRGRVPAYEFHMRQVGRPQRIGSIDLRVGDTYRLRMYGGHIGYGVNPTYRGHHYAARSCRLLFPLARRHGMRELWITCNPENIASRRTCELVGAVFVEIVDLPEDSDMYRIGERRKCRYRVDL